MVAGVVEGMWYLRDSPHYLLGRILLQLDTVVVEDPVVVADPMAEIQHLTQ